VDIRFLNTDLADDCNSFERLVRKYNKQRARLLRRRLDDLHATPNLDAMRNLPGRCHELKGDRRGQLSIDLDGPYRLIFVPDHNPAPRKPDGGLEWLRVMKIVVIEVVDTHE